MARRRLSAGEEIAEGFLGCANLIVYFGLVGGGVIVWALGGEVAGAIMIVVGIAVVVARIRKSRARYRE